MDGVTRAGQDTTVQHETCDGKTLWLPKAVSSVTKATEFPGLRHRWNTNEEVAALLTAFNKHKDWQGREVKIRPVTGSMLLYNRQKIRYRKDGYEWKKRKDGKTTREDHMKLKVQGIECIYGCYVHSAIMPTFHRRCYWLLQNPDLVLVHYLNVPLSDDSKNIQPSLSNCLERTWTSQELYSQLRPMFVETEMDETLNIQVRDIVDELLASVPKTPPALVPSCMCKGAANPCDPGSVCRSRQRIISPRSTETSRAGNGTAPAAHTSANAAQILANLQSKSPKTPKRDLRKSNEATNKQQSPIVLNLSQLQGRNGLIILSQSSAPISFIPSNSSSNNIASSNSNTPAVNSSTNTGPSLTGVSTPRLVSTISSPATSTMIQVHPPLTTSSSHPPPAGSASLNHLPHHAPAPPVHHQNQLINQASTMVSSSVGLRSVDIAGVDHHQSTCISSSPANVGDPLFAQTSVCGSPMKLVGIQGSYVTSGADPGNQNAVRMTNNVVKNSGEVLFPPANSSHHISAISTQQLNEGQGQLFQAQGQLHEGQLFQDQGQINSMQLGPEHVAPAQLYPKSGNGAQASMGGESHLGGTSHLVHQNNVLAHTTASSPSMDFSSIADQDKVEEMVRHLNSNLTTDSSGVQSSKVDNQSASPMAVESLQNNVVASRTPDFTFDDFEDLDLSQFGNHPESLNLEPLHTNLNSAHEVMSTSPTPTSEGRLGNQLACSTCNQSDENRVEMRQGSEGTDRTRATMPGIANITDFCPEWAYTEGGTKLLVTGPWYSTTSPYTILIDGAAQKAVLVQSGVLRCFVPPHASGKVNLQVACEGFVISDSCTFEYRSAKQEGEDHVEEDSERPAEKLCSEIFELLNTFEKHLRPLDDHPICRIDPEPGCDAYETSLISMLSKLCGRRWTQEGERPVPSSQKGANLLHKVVILGYSRLLAALLKWRSLNPGCWLDLELDCFSLDKRRQTPVMLACSKGHIDCAVLLARHSPASLFIRNLDGCLPYDVARRNGHAQLGNSLQELCRRLELISSKSTLASQDLTYGSAVTPSSSELGTSHYSSGNTSSTAEIQKVTTPGQVQEAVPLQPLNSGRILKHPFPGWQTGYSSQQTRSFDSASPGQHHQRMPFSSGASGRSGSLPGLFVGGAALSSATQDYKSDETTVSESNLPYPNPFLTSNAQPSMESSDRKNLFSPLANTTSLNQTADKRVVNPIPNFNSGHPVITPGLTCQPGKESSPAFGQILAHCQAQQTSAVAGSSLRDSSSVFSAAKESQGEEVALRRQLMEAATCAGTVSMKSNLQNQTLVTNQMPPPSHIPTRAALSQSQKSSGLSQPMELGNMSDLHVDIPQTSQDVSHTVQLLQQLQASQPHVFSSSNGTSPGSNPCTSNEATPSPPIRQAQQTRMRMLLKRSSVEVLPGGTVNSSFSPALSHLPSSSDASADTTPEGGVMSLVGKGHAGSASPTLSDVKPIQCQTRSYDGDLPPPGGTMIHGLRPVNSDPVLSEHMLHQANPMMMHNDLNSKNMEDYALPFEGTSGMNLEELDIAMDTDSPYNLFPSVEEQLQTNLAENEDQSHQLKKLADHIVAAMPDRNKAPNDDGGQILLEDQDSPAGSRSQDGRRERSSSHSSFSSVATPPYPAGTTDDSGISTPLETFDDYRYTDLGTPASSLSPASSCLHSPYSFNIDSPPPTAAEFTEYFNAPAFYMEKDFSELTLSDEEQRHLYLAAKLIQNFYRQYKDKKQQVSIQQERTKAAILIQSYYRRYKKYSYFKKMTQAAVLIQSQFRSYYAQKRFKRRRHAATVIQNQYRTYKEHERFKKSRNAAVIIQQRFRSHYQRKRCEQKMAQKIQQAMSQERMHSYLTGQLVKKSFMHENSAITRDGKSDSVETATNSSTTDN